MTTIADTQQARQGSAAQAAIDALRDELPADYDALVNIGMRLSGGQDLHRWALGRIAAQVETRYGEETLTAFAVAVNVRAKTLYEYRSVFSFYGLNFLHLAENLSWSHFREARRMGDLDKAAWALRKAADKDWMIEKFGKIISRYLGTARRDSKPVAEVIVTYDGETDGFVVISGEHQLRDRARYIVRVYETRG